MSRLQAQDVALRLGWLLLTAAALLLVGITTMYYSLCTDCNFLLEKQELIDNPIWMGAFYVHITGGILALVAGPLQFVRRFRSRFPRVHRLLGMVYIVAILLIAGPSGQYMAFHAEGSWVSSLGFLVMAVLWMFTTWQAYLSARKRDFPAHRDWMTRSFAMSLAAVTLRIWVPVSSYYMGLDQELVVESSAWVSWVPNLIVAEMLVRWLPKKL